MKCPFFKLFFCLSYLSYDKTVWCWKQNSAQNIYIYLSQQFFFFHLYFLFFFLYIYILYRKAKKHNTLAKWRLLSVVKCKPNVNVQETNTIYQRQDQELNTILTAKVFRVPQLEVSQVYISMTFKKLRKFSCVQTLIPFTCIFSCLPHPDMEAVSLC